MADNYLERHREEYEKRKAEWLRKKKHLSAAKQLKGVKVKGLKG